MLPYLNELKDFFTAFLLGALLISTVNATEITGHVQAVSGNTVTVVTEGDLLANAGDKVDIFFKIPGSGDEISVAAGKVLAVKATTVTVRIDNTTGTVVKNQLARIHSGPVRTNSPLPSATPSADHPDPDRTRGDAQFAKGDWQTAIVSYSRAIKTNPRDALALFQRARCYFRIGNNDAVIADCSKAIPLGPAYLAEVFVLRGGAYSHKKNFAAALTDYKKAAEIDPRSGRIRAFCGIAQFQMKQFKAALDDLKKAIELDPKLAFAYYHRGFTYEQLGDATGAIADWEKAIQLSPSYSKELQPKIDKLRANHKP